MLALNTLAIGAASFFVVVAAGHGHARPRAHHHDVAERSEHHLQKRFSGTGTYYITGLGACGIYNNPSDKIVALNSAQFGGGYPGPNCFKMITICKGSNCHQAQITDECPTCDYGSLDLSQSLFQQFASTDDGVFQMTWTFNDGADPEPTTTKKADPPKTTSTKKAEPTTTWEPPTTTWEPPTTTTTKKHTSTSSPPPETTSTPEPTTSTTSSTSSVPTTTSKSETPTYAASTSEVPTSAVSTSAAPSASSGTGTGSSSGSGSGSSSGSNLVDMNQVMLGMGRMAVAANGA